MRQNTPGKKQGSSRTWIWRGILGVMLVAGGYLLAGRTRALPAFWRIPAPLPTPATTRDARWQQDLAYLAHELPRLHVNAFHDLSPAAFSQAVADLDAAIPTLDDREIMVRFVQLVATLGDAHTRAYPIDDTEFTLSPLQLHWFEDGIYVINTLPEYYGALNTRVVAVQGLPIEDAAAALASLVAHENEAGLKERLMLYLTSPGLLATLGLTSDETTATWLLERADGTRLTLEVTPILPDAYTATFGDPATTPAAQTQLLYRRRLDDNYWFEILPDTRTLYFAYNRCAGMPAQPFKAFNETLFEAIDAHPVDRLVVDLRNNGGGDSSLLAPFIARLRDHPLNRKGALYVITGRSTFSSAVLNALQLKQKTEAIFVGEATSGNPAHYGEVKTFILANSQMRVTYATKYFPTRLFGASPLNTGDLLGAFGYAIPQWPVSRVPTTTFEPDIRVAPTGADYAAGHDPVLEVILDLS